MQTTLLNKLAYSRILNNPLFLIFITYLLSHGLILANGGIYWDDWLWAVNEPNKLHSAKEIGADYLNLHLIPAFFMDIHKPVFYGKFFIFSAFLIASFSLYLFLKNTLFLKEDALFITLLFSSVPLNFTRNTFSTLNYSLSYALFFLGLYILNRSFRKDSKILYYISFFVFLLSFHTSSFLVFYGLVLVYLLYEFRDLRLLIRIRNLIFPVLLPIGSFVYRTAMHGKSGSYADHNSIDLMGLMSFPLKAPKIITETITFDSDIQGIIILLLLIFYLLKKERRSALIKKITIHSTLLFIGLLSLVLGYFPYHVVGVDIRFQTWSDRAQLLFPLGTALLYVYSVRVFIPKNYQKTVILGLSFIFISIHLTQYYKLQKDWIKQEHILAELKISQETLGNNTFLYTDHVKDQNLFHRDYRIYEWTGMLHYLTGESKRVIATDLNELEIIHNFSESTKRHSLLDNYEKSMPQYHIHIMQEEKLNLWDVLKWTLGWKLVESKRFKLEFKKAK